MRSGAAVAALGAVLIAAAPASASVARVFHQSAILGPHGMEVVGAHNILEYSAGAAEANVLTVAPASGGLTATDTGATIQPGEGCSQVDQHTVRCAADMGDLRTGDGPDRVDVRGSIFTVDTGDGDDEVILHSVYGSVLLGAGADKATAEGAGTRVTLGGGVGNDAITSASQATIKGGAGDDSLAGGTGDDSLAPGPGRDTVTGGGGRDRVDYEGLAERLRIDLHAQQVTAPAAKADRLSGIEDATGGSGADVILGTSGPNELDGGRGDNRIGGRGGRDFLIGGRGRDRLSGGAGNDQLDGAEGNDVESGGPGDDELGVSGEDEGRDRFSGGPGRDEFLADDNGAADAADAVDCGRGRDTVPTFDRLDLLDRSCETARHAGLPMVPTPRRLAGGLAFRLRCPQRHRCRGSLSLLDRRGRRYARTTFEIPAGRWGSVSLHPPPGTARRRTVLSVVVRRRGWEPDGHRFVVR